MHRRELCEILTRFDARDRDSAVALLHETWRMANQVRGSNRHKRLAEYCRFAILSADQGDFDAAGCIVATAIKHFDCETPGHTPSPVYGSAN